jgi:hypothetical protein
MKTNLSQAERDALHLAIVAAIVSVSGTADSQLKPVVLLLRTARGLSARNPRLRVWV